LTIDAIWVPHGGGVFNAIAYRINSPVGSVAFAGDMGTAAPGPSAQKFHLLAASSDVVVMNPYLSPNSPPACLFNRVVNLVNQTCIPGNFPLIHSDSKLTGAFAKAQTVQTLMITHMNPAPDTNNVAPFLSNYERIVTVGDYEASVRSGGYLNSLSVADDYSTVTRVNIRIASLWLFDTSRQVDIVQLTDGATLNLASYHHPAVGLTFRAQVGVGSDLVQSVEFSVNGVRVENDAVTPWCLSNHRHSDGDKDSGGSSSGGDKDKDKADTTELDCRNWNDLVNYIGQTITLKAVGTFTDAYGKVWYGHPLHRSVTIGA